MCKNVAVMMYAFNIFSCTHIHYIFLCIICFFQFYLSFFIHNAIDLILVLIMINGTKALFQAIDIWTKKVVWFSESCHKNLTWTTEISYCQLKILVRGATYIIWLWDHREIQLNIVSWYLSVELGYLKLMITLKECYLLMYDTC